VCFSLVITAHRKKDTGVSIIITRTVPGVGEEGEEMKVKRGYARNFLFPKDYAVYSTPETRQKYAEAAAVCWNATFHPHHQKIDYEERRRRQNIERANKTISKVTIHCKRENVLGNPHSPIDKIAISKTLWKQARIELDPARISQDVTSFGLHEIPIRIGDSEGWNATLKVELSKR